MRGFDAPTPVDALIPRIKAHGYGFVVRYMSYNQHKNLSPGEARKLSAAGLDLVAVFEARGNVIDNFTSEQGAKDAAQALHLASQIGQPEGSAIYFAVDLDATAHQIIVAIMPYFAAVKKGICGKHRVGVYGSGLVCDSLRKADLAELFMLACASGWQGTKTFTGAHLRQSLPTGRDGFGFQVDPDEAMTADFGQFRVPA